MESSDVHLKEIAYRQYIHMHIHIYQLRTSEWIFPLRNIKTLLLYREKANRIVGTATCLKTRALLLDSRFDD